MSDSLSQIQDAETRAREILENAQKTALEKLQQAREAELSRIAELQKTDREQAQKQLDTAKEETARAYNETSSSYTLQLQSLHSLAESRKKPMVDECIATITRYFA